MPFHIHLNFEHHFSYYTAKDNLHKLSTSRTSSSAQNSCLTCGLKCKTNDVTMHPSNGKYFIHTCLNGLEDVPVVSIYQTEVCFITLICN